MQPVAHPERSAITLAAIACTAAIYIILTAPTWGLIPSIILTFLAGIALTFSFSDG